MSMASGDKLGLKLPGLQQELLEAVAAVGKPIVLTVLAGSALDLSWAQEHAQVRAILDCWYPGARGGKAIAEALFGEFFSVRKTAVTFYEGTEFLPVLRLFHGRIVLTGIRTDMCSIRLDMVLPIRRSVI